MSAPPDRARTSLDAARLLAANGFSASAVSRAYYAGFYAAREAVLAEGRWVKTHRGVLSEFSRLFVATGRVEAEASRTLRRLHEERTLADYHDGDVTAGQARRAIDLAERLLILLAALVPVAEQTGATAEPAWHDLPADQRRDLVARLTREMDVAAENLEFEKAAELRDSISQIEATLAA